MPSWRLFTTTLRRPALRIRAPYTQYADVHRAQESRLALSQRVAGYRWQCGSPAMLGKDNHCASVFAKPESTISRPRQLKTNVEPRGSKCSTMPPRYWTVSGRM